MSQIKKNLKIIIQKTTKNNTNKTPKTTTPTTQLQKNNKIQTLVSVAITPSIISPFGDVFFTFLTKKTHLQGGAASR